MSFGRILQRILSGRGGGLLARRRTPMAESSDQPPRFRMIDREQLVQRILSTIRNNSILLCGPPGSGKTRILLHLEERLALDNESAASFYPVYVALRNVPEQCLFTAIRNAVSRRLDWHPEPVGTRTNAPYGHRELARDLRAVITALDERAARSVRLVLLIDDVDQVDRYHPVTRQQIRSLFMAADSQRLAMIASAVAIDRAWEQEGSPWYNFLEELDLSTFVNHPTATG